MANKEQFEARQGGPAEQFLAAEHAMLQAKHRPRQQTHKQAKEEPFQLDFPSPYVKNGVLQEIHPGDYKGACRSPRKEEDEPDFRAPKKVEVVQNFKTFDLLAGKAPFDSSRHTVAVLDDFKKAMYAPNDPKHHGLAHGEVSAAAAEQAGFNVLRLQMHDNVLPATVFSEIDREMKAGHLPLRAGDALNASLGWDSNWKEASCMLDMKITPESYADQRPEIMKRVKEVATGVRPARRPSDGIFLTQMAATQQQVDQLQKDGLTVVHSAGNSGWKNFDIGFANAKVQLAASDFQGHTFPYSARHSLTTAYPSSFEMVYDPSKKAYHLRHTHVYFPEKDFDGPPAHNHCERVNQKGVPHESLVHSWKQRISCPVAVLAGSSFSNVQYWLTFKHQLRSTTGP